MPDINSPFNLDQRQLGCCFQGVGTLLSGPTARVPGG
jgi:hypothetical protein